jgi:hypothetical protein
MNRYEIIVKVGDENKALDTFSANPISLNYNIADIKDISSRNSSYSKTITVPETGNNRQIFNDIGSLIGESDFNPNKKTQCWVLVDSVTIFKGFLQIRNVKTNKNTGKTDYELVIYADNDNFFKEIGDDFLTDLDFTELNHAWNATNIVNSWTASNNNGYYYPLIDYGYNWDNMGNINGFLGSQVDIREIYPATNVKYILDKIFGNVGYQYESDFLNSDVFKNLYIPFNQKEFINNEIIDSTGQIFSVGMTAAVTLTNATNINVPAVPPLPNIGQVNFGQYRFPFDNENSPYGDPNNFYDIVLFEYEAPADFTSQRFVVNIDIQLPSMDFIGLNGVTSNIWFARSKNPLTGVDTTLTEGEKIPIGGSTNAVYIGTPNDGGLQIIPGATVNDPVRIIGQLATNFLDNSPSPDGRFNKLYATEKVTVRIRIAAKNTADFHALFSQPANSPFNIVANTFNVIKFNDNTSFFNIINPNIIPGDVYPYNSAIPKKFKQKDFITSIIKMFNLYVEPSKEFNKTLIIEPRDEYYQLGEVKDWTKKLDISQDIDIQILGDTQNNEIVLTYKSDTDFYNKDYLERKTNGEVYGQYNEFLDNDFVSGVRKVEPEFAATPLVALIGQANAQSNMVIPNIFKENNGTIEKSESKPRILTRFYSSTKTSWDYDDFVFYSDSGQPNNAKTLLTTSGFTNVAHNFDIGDVISITQSDGGSAQPWLNGTFEIVEIPDNLSIVIDKFFVGPGGPPVSGTAQPVDGLVGLGPQTQNGAIDRWVFEGVTYSLYPYLGHFNHPLRPNYDINFGQTDGLYYATSFVTNDNLYEVYWRNTLKELFDKSSKIINADFFLTAGDIADFNFYDIIFVDGQYYKVNKIEYDPTKNNISKVELLKSNYSPVIIKQKKIIPPLPIIRNPDGTTPFNPIGPIRPDRKPGNFSSSSTNVIQGTGNIVTGKGNIVTNNDNYVAGVDNIVTGKNNTVNGDNNKVESGSEKVFIFGDNNTIEDGVVDTIVFGSGLNITESNLVIVPNLEVDGDITTDTNNIVIVSLNGEVIDTLGTNVYNSILGGSNNTIEESQSSAILGGGSNTIEIGAASNILGGDNNLIDTSNDSTIINGQNNTILSGARSVILGGQSNAISFNNNSIVGGQSNQVTCIDSNGNGRSSIVGGVLNVIENNISSSVILGGEGNSIDNSLVFLNQRNTIIGGFLCDAVDNTVGQVSIINSNTSDISGSQAQNIVINSTFCEIINSNQRNSILNSDTSDITNNSLNCVLLNSVNSVIIGRINITAIGMDNITLNAAGDNNKVHLGRDTIVYGSISVQNTLTTDDLVVVSSITPTGTADTQGVVGQITWDDDWVYVKTSVGWKRSALSTF